MAIYFDKETNALVAKREDQITGPLPGLYFGEQSLFTCSSTVPRNRYWYAEIGRVLLYLFERVSYPLQSQVDFMRYFDRAIIPQLGPTPVDFQELGKTPCTFFSDDHTPVELIWAIDHDGSQSIRFAMEPLDAVNGTPSPSEDWMSELQKLRSWKRATSTSLEWTDICRETLVVDDLTAYGGKHPSQFFHGADFTKDSIVGKFYFLPHLRASAEGVDTDDLVTECISRLGLSTPWSQIMDYISSIPDRARYVPDMIAVDGVSNEKNRFKVYFRCDVTTLKEVCDVVRLGGALDDELLTTQTINLLERMWAAFFPGVGPEENIELTRPRRPAHGFLIYFEMKMGTNKVWPKVYFPVRQYCRSDGAIADAISEFYAETNPVLSSRYKYDLQTMFPHRDLYSRTGIQTYVGCCIRKGGPQLSVYMSPEVFAPERIQEDYNF